MQEENKVVTKEDMKALPKIVAVDFDGTLVSEDYPNIGTPNRKMFNLVKTLKKSGIKIILWTCRTGKELEDAVALCRVLGLEFDAVNDNLEELKILFPDNARKVYADMYIDDKGICDIETVIHWGHKLGLEYKDFQGDVI